MPQGFALRNDEKGRDKSRPYGDAQGGLRATCSLAFAGALAQAARTDTLAGKSPRCR
ncbi:MAG: hypothetical protein ACOC7P_02050 [Chloroflexota bacterium]